MPKIEFTSAELAEIFRGDMRGQFYNDAVEKAKRIRVHANGECPADIIDASRPNEDEEAKKYRLSIYKPKTQRQFTKVFNSLSKIRRSSDWSILFPSTDDFPRIADDETLQMFIEKRFPKFGSITNWAFMVLLREYLIDPNALIFVLPETLDVAENEYIRPEPHIISSEHRMVFVAGDYAVFKNPVPVTYRAGNNRSYTGDSYYLATTQSVFRFDQKDAKKNFQLVYQWDHNTGILPVDEIGAVVVEMKGGEKLHESRIAAMVPELDEAVRENSDLQIAKVLNLYPERWEMATAECSACQSTGKLPTGDVCPTCNGTGDAPSPFNKIVVKRGSLNDLPLPIPPAGFIARDVEVLKLMEQSVNNHMFDALAAVNMEFLDQVPMNESGRAKEIDRDETNNFVHSIAEDIVRVMDWFIRVAARARYGAQYSPADIDSMIPAISVPEHFDLFSLQFTEDELKRAKDNGINPVIISYMEQEFASKKFSTSETDVLAVVQLILEHDPLANVSEETKVMRLQNRGITRRDYIVSSNIQSFIRRAIEENPNFPGLPYADQRAMLDRYAGEIENAAAPGTRNIIEELNNNGG